MQAEKGKVRACVYSFESAVGGSNEEKFNGMLVQEIKCMYHRQAFTLIFLVDADMVDAVCLKMKGTILF